MTADLAAHQATIQIRTSLHRLANETTTDTQAVMTMLGLLDKPALEALTAFTLLLLRKVTQRDAETLGIPEHQHIDQICDEMRQWLT